MTFTHPCTPQYTIPSSNSSQVAGILSPIGNVPLDYDQLCSMFNALFATILNIDRSLVIEFNQVEPGPMPKDDVTWVSYGIDFTTEHEGSTPIQEMTDNGLVLTYYQEIKNLVTIYGPNRWGYESRLKAGLLLGQNREFIAQHGLVISDVTASRNTSILVQNKWKRILNFRISFRRPITYTYNVESLTSVSFDLHTDP